MRTNQPPSKLRRYLVRGAISSGCTSVAFLLIFWFVLQHKPGWYRPVDLDEAGMAEARREATTAADSFGDQLVRRKPFDFSLDGEMITRWLGAMREIAPDEYSQLPAELSAPAVSFADGAMLVGAHMESKGWRFIVSAAVTATISEQGRCVDLKIAGLSGGSMPLPHSIVMRVLGDGGSEAGVKVLHDGDRVTIADLFHGVRIQNNFLWPNGKRRFRLGNIAVQDGKLWLRIEPM